MSDLLTEVDEAMKQERLEKLWQQYGGFFIGFIAMIILGTASNSWYKNWKEGQNIKQTNLYIGASSKPNVTSTDILKITPELKDGLRGIVELHAAGLAIENGDTEAALDIYKKIANNENLDSTARYIAKYMALNQNKGMALEEKRAQYQSLYTDDKNPWRFHAIFDMALLEANETREYKKARQLLSIIIKEPSVAETMKKKAKSLDILYAAKGKI